MLSKAVFGLIGPNTAVSRAVARKTSTRCQSSSPKPQVHGNTPQLARSASSSARPAPIAILGGGPAGLVLGRLLHRANIDFVIFDRDRSASWAFDRGGSGALDFEHDTGLVAIKEAGLLSSFSRAARQQVTTRIADSKGDVVVEMTPTSDEASPEIDRRDLRSALLDSIPEDKINWGATVETVARQEDGVSITFADGHVVSDFSLVVGADGAWSKTRAMLTPIRPVYLGVTFLTTTIEKTSPVHAQVAALARGGNYFAFGVDSGLHINGLRDDGYYLGAVIRVEEDEHESLRALPDAASMHRVVRRHLAGWPAQQVDFFQHGQGRTTVWPQYSLLPGELAWTRAPDVTLVGDAAHLTSGGGGVNAALYDSYRLSQEIIAHGMDNLPAAVQEYEKEMLSRSKKRLTKCIKELEGMYGPGTPRSWLGM